MHNDIAIYTATCKFCTLGRLEVWRMVIVYIVVALVLGIASTKAIIALNRYCKRVAARRKAIAAQQKVQQLRLRYQQSNDTLQTVLQSLFKTGGIKGSGDLQQKAQKISAALSAQLRAYIDYYSNYGNPRGRTVAAYRTMVVRYGLIQVALQKAAEAHDAFVRKCENYSHECNAINIGNIVTKATLLIQEATEQIGRLGTSHYGYLTAEADTVLAVAQRQLDQANQDKEEGHLLSAVLGAHAARQAAQNALDIAVNIPVRHAALKIELGELNAAWPDTIRQLHHAISLLQEMRTQYTPNLLARAERQLNDASNAAAGVTALLQTVKGYLDVQCQNWDEAEKCLERVHQIYAQIAAANELIETTHHSLGEQLKEVGKLREPAEILVSKLLNVLEQRIKPNPHIASYRQRLLYNRAHGDYLEIHRILWELLRKKPIDPMVTQQNLRCIITDLKRIRQESDYERRRGPF